MTGQRFPYLNQWDSLYVLRAVRLPVRAQGVECLQGQPFHTRSEVTALPLTCLLSQSLRGNLRWALGMLSGSPEPGRTLRTCSVLRMCVTVWPLGATPGCLTSQLSLKILSLSLFPQALHWVLAHCCFHRLSTGSSSHTLINSPKISQHMRQR